MPTVKTASLADQLPMLVVGPGCCQEQQSGMQDHMQSMCYSSSLPVVVLICLNVGSGWPHTVKHHFKMNACPLTSMHGAGATAALRGGAKFSMLSAPKFALRSLAQSLAREFQAKVMCPTIS